MYQNEHVNKELNIKNKLNSEHIRTRKAPSNFGYVRRNVPVVEHSIIGNRNSEIYKRGITER